MRVCHYRLQRPDHTQHPERKTVEFHAVQPALFDCMRSLKLCHWNSNGFDQLFALEICSRRYHRQALKQTHVTVFMFHLNHHQRQQRHVKPNHHHYHNHGHISCTAVQAIDTRTPTLQKIEPDCSELLSTRMKTRPVRSPWSPSQLVHWKL